MKLFNPRRVLRVLDSILLIGVFCFLLCVPVALIYDEPVAPFLWSAGITFLISSLTTVFSVKKGKDKLSNRDSYLIVTGSWVLFILVGTLPYLLSGTITSFADAFFESCSGFTTTGSSIFSDVESLPYSILFWRSLTHWIGGLGIIVFVILVLPSLGITGYQLFTLESSLKEKIHPKTQSVGFRLLYIYLSLTALQIVLMMLGGVDLFESTCLSFSTIATGGFSVRNTSVADYSAFIQYVVMLFMFLGGISFVVYYYLFKLNFTRVRRNEELWFYSIIILFSGILMMSFLNVNSAIAPARAFRESFFNSISIITSTGFAISDYARWPGPAMLLCFLLMFSGACTGSTTGSIKIARHAIVMKSIKATFSKLVHPSTLSTLKFNGKMVSERMAISILSFVLIYLFIFLIGTLIVVLAGMDLLSGASSVAASLGNTGPGLGTVGPMASYAHFPWVIKIILSLLMIVGRIEVVAILTLFTKSFWKP